jgi:hypothetical protein
MPNCHTQDYRVPVEVDIFLWGFNNDGAYGFHLDHNRLMETLATRFTHHCPAVWEEGEALSTCLQVHYNIQHVDANVQVGSCQPRRRSCAPLGAALPDRAPASSAAERHRRRDRNRPRSPADPLRGQPTRAVRRAWRSWSSC